MSPALSLFHVRPASFPLVLTRCMSTNPDTPRGTLMALELKLSKAGRSDKSKLIQFNPFLLSKRLGYVPRLEPRSERAEIGRGSIQFNIPIRSVSVGKTDKR